MQNFNIYQNTRYNNEWHSFEVWARCFLQKPKSFLYGSTVTPQTNLKVGLNLEKKAKFRVCEREAPFSEKVWKIDQIVWTVYPQL